MPIFALMAESESFLLDFSIRSTFPENYLKVGPGQYLVSAMFTTPSLICAKINVSGGAYGKILVLCLADCSGTAASTFSYSGWHDPKIWNWLSEKANAEKFAKDMLRPTIPSAITVDNLVPFFKSLESLQVDTFTVNAQTEAPKLKARIGALSPSETAKFAVSFYNQVNHLDDPTRQKLLSDPNIGKIVAAGADSDIRRVATGAAAGAAVGAAIGGIISSAMQSINNPLAFVFSFMALGTTVGALGALADECQIHLTPSMELSGVQGGASVVKFQGIGLDMVFTKPTS